jgi:tetratricopeptide (TPR) repeat protein
MNVNKVKAWEEVVTIPTYEVGQPNKNPMFLEKRVYQGSSGVVYPFAVIDQVYDEKKDKEYHVVFLENEFLKIMIMPELGGRIQMAYDKTNDYHFIYYNRVIKPALVGLTGPWVSGGIEFNWPQHHRPSTFEPVDFSIENHADGSATVWVSEIEKMFHTKGMAGFRLYPGKAYLEITGRLYNRTFFPQTFLWWANPAASVDEYYQSVFPPDVHAVYDHGKRDVSLFPIAKGTYYKTDYSPGTDISWYKNIPVPTSYMAVGSEFDFVGGYHHRKKAGILHIANHHISPGKKQWTWGHADFGKSWDKHLTDEDGPYIEIMTGVYTDNQPDFSWIMPNQEITFQQYFLPYKEIGYIKNATKEALINLEVKDQKAFIKLYVTSARENVLIQLEHGHAIIFETTENLSPVTSYQIEVDLPQNFSLNDLKVIVTGQKGELLVSYQPVQQKNEDVAPDPAKPLAEPKDIKTNEGLFLAGQHLEQYRHATYSPIDYYEEALRRDDTDIRTNNALGLWWLRKGKFAIAENYFTKAVNTLLKHNRNPYDGEPLYNLGISLFMQGRKEEAVPFLFKAGWNAAWKDNAYLQLARITASEKKWNDAIALANQSLARNNHGYKARHLKTMMLQKMNRLEEAEKLAKKTLALDPFDFGSGYELYKIYLTQNKKEAAEEWLQTLKTRLRNDEHTSIEIAIDYAWCGLYEEAIEFLSLVDTRHPLHAYYKACYFHFSGNKEKGKEFAQLGFSYSPDREFPNRLEDIGVLQFIINNYPKDYKANYYLGNLWYDRRQYDDAIECWERSVNIYDGFATVYRNLGIAYCNRLKDKEKALNAFERSFSLDEKDARVLFELDQLYKRLNKPVSERLSFLKKYFEDVNDRDDLYLEYVTLLNLSGQFQQAANALAARKFHPWEGGEGRVIKQYLVAQKGLAFEAMGEGDWDKALEYLNQTEHYPANLGEGRLPGTSNNEINYWKGIAFSHLNKTKEAEECLLKAASGKASLQAPIFYNDPPPDVLFYQGLALRKLNREEEAKQRFESMKEYSKEHINDTIKIDYFAVSLPDLSVFDDDLNVRNKIHCLYLAVLGYIGLCENEEAKKHLHELLKLNKSHVDANILLKSPFFQLLEKQIQ